MPKTLRLPPGGDWPRHSGIDVAYYKTRREIEIGGWYDTCVGIQSTRLPLGDFLRALGITLRDCERELAAGAKEASDG